MKNKLKLIFVFTFFWLNMTEIYAQFAKKTEVEIILDNSKEENFVPISLSENGVLILHTQIDFSGRNFKVNFLRFDSTLHGVWKTEFVADDQFLLEKYYLNNHNLYCLFKKIDSKQIKVMKLDLENGSAITNELNMLTDMDIRFFAAIESKVVVAGIFNDKPVAELIKLFDKSAKVLPHIYSSQIKIEAIEVNNEQNEIFVMLKDEKTCQFILAIYDADGKLTSSKQLGEKNKALMTGKILNLPNKKKILSGNYSENCSDYSSGYYFLPLENYSAIQYFPFTELENFHSYLPEKRQEKIKTRVDIKKRKGKEIKMRYRINLHQPIRFEDDLVLVSEIYYPEYKTTTSYRSDYRLNHAVFNKNFNNFKFTHALISVFNLMGEKKWDYSINLMNNESPILNEKVQITKLEDRFLVAYPKENYINTQLIARNQKASEFQSINLDDWAKTSTSTDISTDLLAWYGHHYLAFGQKTIKKENGMTGLKVFYLSKLSYQKTE
jgi:hypothetical protein